MNDIEKQILENELALALDAAQKGDKARLECGAMEVEISYLKNYIQELEYFIKLTACSLNAEKEARDEIKKLKDERDSLQHLLETYRQDAERYRFLRSAESNGKVDLCVTKAFWGALKGGEAHYLILTKEEADEAIAAAMQENK